MNRRAFIAGLGGAAAWPLAGRAQQSTKPVIGFLGSTSPEGAAAPIEAVRQSLKDAGVDPGNVQFDYQFAQGHYDRLPVLASELVRKNVAVIIASGSANAAVAAKTATRSIPVVFLNGSDPVVFGLVPNINRPEGNITGVTTFTNAMGAKRLGILRELVPNAAHVSMLINPSSAIIAPEVEETRAAAVATGVQLEIIAASTEGDRLPRLIYSRRADPRRLSSALIHSSQLIPGRLLDWPRETRFRLCINGANSCRRVA